MEVRNYMIQTKKEIDYQSPFLFIPTIKITLLLIKDFLYKEMIILPKIARIFFNGQ